MKQHFTYYILILFWFVLGTPAQAQQDTITPILQNIVRSKIQDISQLNKQLKRLQYDSIVMKKLAQESQQENFHFGEIFAYSMLGKINRINTNFSKAIYYHQKAYELAKKYDNLHFQIYSLNMIGVVYRRMDAVKSALEYHNKALDIAQHSHSNDQQIIENIAISHNSIGNIYLLLKRDDLALTHFKKALEIEKKHNNKLGLAINYQNIGSIFENKGELNKALDYYQKSLQYNNEINSKVGKVICNTSISDIYIKKNDLKKAKEFTIDNLKLARELGDNYYLSEIYVHNGKIEVLSGNYKKAEQLLTNGLQIALKKNIPSVAADAYEQFTILKEKQGKFKEALQYHKKFNTEQSKVLNEKNQQLVADLIIKQLRLENQEKLKKLGQENILVKTKLNKTKKNLYLSILIFLLMIVSGFVLYYRYQLKNQRKMVNMEQNLLRAQMNPHFIFNSLNSVKMFIIQNRPKDAVDFISKFAKLIRSILQSTFEKEMTLKEEIETIKLYVDIENTRFDNQIHFNINIDHDLELDQIKIPPLLTQPFIENALWHGLSPKKNGDKKLTINIFSKNNNTITIEITDNGIGRKKAMQIKAGRTFKRESVGIKLSNERLEHFSKKYKSGYQIIFKDLTDENGHANGTKVIIEIPYK